MIDTLRKEILEYSFIHNMEHIPSALSWCDFMSQVLELTDLEEKKFVFGKFYGTQGVYVPLRNIKGYNIDNLSYFINPSELPFVVEASHTIADSIGFAVGYSHITKQDTITIISDAVLQSGYTYESILYMKKFNPNLLLLVDNNCMQVCSTTESILDISPCIKMLTDLFPCARVNGHSDARDTIKHMLNMKGARVIIFDTVKGKGVSEMEMNDKWHYRKIADKAELERLCV